jgi:hypothetical protein
MNSDNSKPAGSSGTDVLEPPEHSARVTPAVEPEDGAQTPLPIPTYSLYPPPQLGQDIGGHGMGQGGYTNPPQQPIVRQGASPLTVILSIVGVVILLGLIFVVAAVLMVSNIVGQVTNPAVGELRTETQSVALGDAKSVVANVSIGVGKLDISGGATDPSTGSGQALMNATFNYNVAAWKPTVSYNVNADGGEGTLLVQQPSQGSINTGANVRYDWDLRFKNDVPMTMKVDIGVGQGNLKFGGLNLSKLEVNSGVGDTTVDLSGQWQKDVNVLVNGGVGQVTIIVPTDTGVRITAEGGLGHVSANGLTVNGNTYTNSAYGTAPSTINIDVKTGIGNIQLVQGR